MLNPINQYLISLDGYKLMLEAPHKGTGQVTPHLLNVSYSEALATYEAGGFTLKKAPSENKGFHLLLEVLHESKLLGHIYSDPTKKYGHSKALRPFHINNEALYTMDFALLVPKLLVAFDIQIHNHSHLHICLFTQQVNPALLIEMAQKQTAGFILMSGINVKEEIYTDNKGYIKGVTTLLNSQSKRVVGAIYNKSDQLRQLKASEQKPYVLDWLVAHGFDATRTTYSYELRIEAKALTVYKALAVTEDGEVISAYRANNNESTKTTRLSKKDKTELEISKLQHPAYLAALFQKFQPIDIRKDDRSRPANCTKVELIDFGIYGDEDINQKVTVGQRSPTMEKRTLRDILQEFKKTNAPSFLYASVHLAVRYNLREAFFSLIGEKQISGMQFTDARPSSPHEHEPAFVSEIRKDFNRLIHLKGGHLTDNSI